MCYLLFFPCLCHGPIERINTLVSRDRTREDVLYGIKKILLGLIKINVYFHFLRNLTAAILPGLLIVYIKTINFYLVVTGRLGCDCRSISTYSVSRYGRTYPRVFFCSRTLTDLWRNGNATLIDWYFSYFYVPLAKNGKWFT